MIISNCPACVNGTGCCSPHTNSVECDKVEACTIKQIVIACQTANDACDGLISADVVLGYLSAT